jgi:hypothetical protein
MEKSIKLCLTQPQQDTIPAPGHLPQSAVSIHLTLSSDTDLFKLSGWQKTWQGYYKVPNIHSDLIPEKAIRVSHHGVGLQ